MKLKKALNYNYQQIIFKMQYTTQLNNIASISCHLASAIAGLSALIIHSRSNPKGCFHMICIILQMRSSVVIFNISYIAYMTQSGYRQQNIDYWKNMTFDRQYLILLMNVNTSLTQIPTKKLELIVTCPASALKPGFLIWISITLEGCLTT